MSQINIALPTKLNLFLKKQVPKEESNRYTEFQAMLKDLSNRHDNLEAWLDEEADSQLVEATIYELKSLELKYSWCLRQARAAK